MSEAETQPIEQRFLASVSHEIRTPLNGILGMASLLAETELTPAQADYVSAIRRSGARLLDLLNNVLDYARMDAAGVELETAETDIRGLAQDVVELLSPRAHEKGIDVCVRAAGDLPEKVVLDDGRVRQILFNIVGNAIKFTEKGGVLVDLSTLSDKELCIDIIDSGPGLTDEAQARLFNAFEQAEAGHRGIDGGVGLGLTIVNSLVEAMNGSVTITSAPGIGARFRILLPLDIAAEAKPAERAGQPKRIGLAGMSAPLMLSLASMADAAGHTILTEADGSEVDIWLADARLPPSELKRLGHSAPVIALIRPEDRDHIENLRANGCAGYLMRPVREASLMERLAVSGSAAEPEATEQTSQFETGRILIADDNAVNALLATRVLEKAGHACTTAATGAEALEAVQFSHFDVILMDLRMPVMDGYEAMRQIRALTGAEKNNTPIIAISAEINPDVEKAAKAAGADAVAAKPLDAHTLRSIVDRWTDRQKAQA